MIPDYLPQLRRGTGRTPKDGGCLVQVAGFLFDGESWTDDTPCVHPLLRQAAIEINDSLSDAGLKRLSVMAARISGSNTTLIEGWTEANEDQLLAGLSQWAVREAQAAVDKQEFSFTCSTTHLDEARHYADKRPNFDWTSGAVFSALNANACTFRTIFEAAVYDDEPKIGFLTRLVDEYDRLTGRTSHDLTPEQGRLVCDLISV